MTSALPEWVGLMRRNDRRDRIPQRDARYVSIQVDELYFVF